MKSRAYVLLFFLIIGVRKGGNGKKDYFGVLNTVNGSGINDKA